MSEAFRSIEDYKKFRESLPPEMLEGFAVACQKTAIALNARIEEGADEIEEMEAALFGSMVAALWIDRYETKKV